MKRSNCIVMALIQVIFLIPLCIFPSYGASVKLEDITGVPKGLNIDDDGNLGVVSSTNSVEVMDTNGEAQGVNIDEDGNVGISLESSGEIGPFTLMQVALGQIEGASLITRVGKIQNVGAGDEDATFWGGANVDGIGIFPYTYSTTAIIQYISSSSASDTGTVLVTGLNGSYELITQSITLTGQTTLTLTTPLLRILSIANMSTADWVGYIYVYTMAPSSGGVPTNTNSIRAIAHGDDNRNMMGMYTIPLGYTGYLVDVFTNFVDLSSTVGASFLLWTIPENTASALTYYGSFFASNGGEYHPFKGYPKLEAKTDIELQANPTEDSTSMTGGFTILLIQD